MPPELYAADHLDAALAAAREAARRLGVDHRALVLLHQSNNVVLRVRAVVFKVGGDATRMRREVTLAADAVRRGGPVNPPLGHPVAVDPFVVSAWPYLEPDPLPADDETAARALASLHRSMAQTPLSLPSLADRFAGVLALLDDESATAALAPDGRRVLAEALHGLAPLAVGDVVLHGEPHDGNRITRAGAVRYFDLEAACRGPLEWDLAYLAEPVANLVWPEHDRKRCRSLRVAVSACVSVYCWRHLTARPETEDLRWHADQHLGTVRRAIDGT